MHNLNKIEVTKIFIEESRKLGYDPVTMKDIHYFMRIIWMRPTVNVGWALTQSGADFLTDILHIDPYPIPCDGITISSRFLVDLDKAMKWPYRFQGGQNCEVLIYSQEVATWAGLCGKDIKKLINSYNGIIDDK